MRLEMLMEQLAEEGGVPPFVTNGDGGYDVEINAMPVSIQRTDDDHIVLQAAVGVPPPNAVEARERLYRVMLEAMFRGSGSGGAVLSLDKSSGTVFLHRTESAAVLDYDGFKALLETFVGTLDQWRRIVTEFNPVAERMERDAQEAAEASRDMNMSANGFIQV